MSDREVAGKVVVITGASSGIGRATAIEFSRRGAAVVLAARRDEALQEVVAECVAAGGAALAVPTDVTSEEAVIELARQAVQRFGRIDVWVNNAAVAMFSGFEDAPMEMTRRVVETNLFGYVHGARAVMPQFRQSGSGVLINVDSLAAAAPQPYAAAYVASKYAIRGFFEAVRMELELDRARGIHICNVMPPAVDTPLFQQSANYSGLEAKPPGPIWSPEDVAKEIVSLAARPRREVILGASAKAMASQHSMSPRLYEKTASRVLYEQQFQNKPTAPKEGNLFEPMPEYASTHGGWKRPASQSGRIVQTAAIALPALLLALALRPKR